MQRFLFDRLCQPERVIPSTVEDRVTLLRQMITQELQWLVSQRAYFEGFNSVSNKSVLNFGISDVVSYSTAFSDIERLKDEIYQAILMWEPRLKSPTITLKATNNPLKPAIIYVEGIIEEDQIRSEFQWQSSSELE